MNTSAALRAVALLILFCAVCAAGVVFARSESSMKCGTRYVNLGDATSRVEDLCGSPSGRESYDRARPSIIYDPGLDRTREVNGGTDHMEIWTYDQGVTKFVRTLTFENGKLLKIEAGGYGG